MGNAGSNMPRERYKSNSSDIVPNSPVKDGQAFTFEKKPDTRLVFQGSQEDEEQPYYTKPSSVIGGGNSASATAVTTTGINNSTGLDSSSVATTTTTTTSDFPSPMQRQRSNTVSEGTTQHQHNITTTLDQQNVTQSSSSAENSINQIIQEDDKKPALPTVFKWDGGGKQVYISGTFSNWKALPMVKSHGDFVTIIDLPEGDHQYKFCVDGEWRHDPKLKNIENDIGTKNNLVSVRQSDFEVFQALAKDSEDAANQGQKEYSQDIPQIKPWEKVSGPPVLPPHLLQVILNKDTPLSCEPTLLPEPNHVMLNHLYALSIKDGVMVLSATHRYRKKYVTTLLYKPI